MIRVEKAQVNRPRRRCWELAMRPRWTPDRLNFEQFKSGESASDTLRAVLTLIVCRRQQIDQLLHLGSVERVVRAAGRLFASHGRSPAAAWRHGDTRCAGRCRSIRPKIKMSVSIFEIAAAWVRADQLHAACSILLCQEFDVIGAVTR